MLFMTANRSAVGMGTVGAKCAINQLMPPAKPVVESITRISIAGHRNLIEFQALIQPQTPMRYGKNRHISWTVALGTRCAHKLLVYLQQTIYFFFFVLGVSSMVRHRILLSDNNAKAFDYFLKKITVFNIQFYPPESTFFATKINYAQLWNFQRKIEEKSQPKETIVEGWRNGKKVLFDESFWCRKKTRSTSAFAWNNSELIGGLKKQYRFLFFVGVATIIIDRIQMFWRANWRLFMTHNLIKLHSRDGRRMGAGICKR